MVCRCEPPLSHPLEHLWENSPAEAEEEAEEEIKQEETDRNRVQHLRSSPSKPLGEAGGRFTNSSNDQMPHRAPATPPPRSRWRPCTLRRPPPRMYTRSSATSSTSAARSVPAAVRSTAPSPGRKRCRCGAKCRRPGAGPRRQRPPSASSTHSPARRPRRSCPGRTSVRCRGNGGADRRVFVVPGGIFF